MCQPRIESCDPARTKIAFFFLFITNMLQILCKNSSVIGKRKGITKHLALWWYVMCKVEGLEEYLGSEWELMVVENAAALLSLLNLLRSGEEDNFE